MKIIDNIQCIHSYRDKDENLYGGKYKLVKSSGYNGFRGLMTWSINWDAKNNFEFSNNYRDYFNNLK